MIRKTVTGREELLVQRIVNELDCFANGFTSGEKNYIIGVSGGIDSAICLALAVLAVGKDRVIPILMPSNVTSHLSNELATKLCQRHGIRDVHIRKFDISQIAQKYDDQFEHCECKHMFTLAHENLQARIRGTILMTYANQYNGLVIETCNKSESLMGYCTLYGDTCGAISPIGDLYKSEVYSIAKTVKRLKISNAIIMREPTAELSDGQKDTDSLPPYNILDTILIMYYEKKLKIDVIAEMTTAFEQTLTCFDVNQIIQQSKDMQFKRDQSPPTIKLEL